VPAQLNHRIEVGFFSILLHYADAFGATDVVSERGDGAIERVRALTQHMQDVFKRVNAMSKAPLEFIWLEELAP
jgi:hypothetical protein